MKAEPAETTGRLVNLFADRKCWTIAELSGTLGYAAISVRRFLGEAGYCRSYNHNGKWYTLLSIPTFNRKGIWFYDNIGFSRHGSLTRTIVHLLGRSPQGYSPGSLADILGVSCHAVLTHMHKAGRVAREKFGGGFVYLAADRKTNRRQRKRQELRFAKEPAGSLGSEAAVFVLVEFIKRPRASFEEISRMLQRNRRITVSSESIAQFFRELEIKKTPESKERSSPS